MYTKTSKIIIPIEAYIATRTRIGRDRVFTIIKDACRANQLDNWNNGDTREGDTVFVPRNINEKQLWEAIRLENRKLFQRSNAGKQPRDMHKKI